MYFYKILRRLKTVIKLPGEGSNLHGWHKQSQNRNALRCKLRNWPPHLSWTPAGHSLVRVGLVDGSLQHQGQQQWVLRLPRAYLWMACLQHTRNMLIHFWCHNPKNVTTLQLSSSIFMYSTILKYLCTVNNQVHVFSLIKNINEIIAQWVTHMTKFYRISQIL